MKKRLWSFFLTLVLCLTLLPVAAFAEGETGVAINETNFPDANFRTVVKEYDTDKDENLSRAEIEAVKEIKCYYKEIRSLTGIEYFTALQTLECYSNLLTSLDISGNTALKSLDCAKNQLAALDVSQNTALESLNCADNQLTALDISQNTALEYLICASNKLTALNVSGNATLKFLNCSTNELTELNVDQNAALNTLNCLNNRLTSLNVSLNLNLQDLNCARNQLAALDVQKNTALKSLYCGHNQLTVLDVGQNRSLDSLSCENNLLTSLNVSQNTALHLLLCFNNHLTSLDTSNQKSLHTLSCNNNNYPITITNDRNYDLSDLPGTFDVNKASNWSGGTVSGNILTVDHDKDSVTYTYDCGNGRTKNFMLTCGKASYTVNFNTNGGSEVDTQTVVHGEKVVKPADPKLNGFTFGGWYTDEDCTDENKYDFETPVTANFTLYAKWEGTFYGIRITDKDGEVYYVTSKNANDVLGDGTVVYVPGYIEEGKNLDDFTAEDLDKMLRGETVEGIRLPKLTLNGAEFKQLAAGNWGNDSMTRQLNLFLQLELMGDNTIAYDETYLAEGAVYSKNVWALFITGNGKLNVTAPAENGWGLSGDWGLYRQESGTVTITAGKQGIWYDTWSSFNLTFHGGRLTIEAGTDPEISYSGVINSWEKISFDISESTTFLLGDSAENCISLTAPYTIDSVRQELTDAYDEGKLTHDPFYLSLTANYTVTFDTNGGSAVESQTVAYGGQAAAPAAPAKPGYTFAGWERDGKAYDFTAPVTANMTLTAKWTANQYTITFDLDGGTVEGNPDTYTAETESFTLKNPTRPGYTFTGWSGTGLTGENNMTVTIQKGSTGDRSYTAHWRYNGGGSGGSSSYPITVPGKTENGSVTVSPKSASAGSTVTITVKLDSGYVLETISVTDKNGNDLKLTDKGGGKYTFTMPTSKVEIKATFMEDNSVLNFFYDVPNDAYYYEAVKWAAENGITGGVGNSLFAPNQPCTRAQIVTFLWRAAGSPVVNYLMPFTDVDEGAYYAEAVRWAASCGIVTGQTETTFGTDSVCTRAQAAAMIYRCAQAQGKGFTGAWMFHLPFTDVPEWAYESVAWCYMNGVTTGVSETSFAPGNDCTRAQIVTFLWRAFSK